MRKLSDSREDRIVLMMHLVKTVEEGHSMEHSMEQHKDKIINHHQEEETLYHLQRSGEIIEAHL